jgi:hypothetical protein
MVTGLHVLVYSTDPDADQDVLQRILKCRSVPAEPGRIIIALPPAEVATHLGDGGFTQVHADRELLGAVLYLMCDDLDAAIRELREDGVACSDPEDTEFGPKTTIVLPSGGEIGLYQPSHETACG